MHDNQKIMQKALERFDEDEIPDEVPESLPLVEEFCREELPSDVFADVDVLFIQHHLGPFIPRMNNQSGKMLIISNKKNGSLIRHQQ